MKHYIFLLIFLVGTSTAQAQTINYFNKTFKPDTMNILSPAILALENGGYIVAHTYNTLNNYEGFAIRRIGSTGETEWFKHLDYGQEEHVMIGGGVLSATPDGLFMLVGSKGEVPLVSGGNRDILMIKFDIEGNVIWSKTNGDPDKIENAYHITPTQDGGYIMCGIQRGFTTSNRFYVLKTDAFGNKEWDSTYSSGAKGLAYSIAEVLGGYLVSGYRVQANNQMYLIKIDNQGLLQWEITYGDNTQHNTGCVVEKLDSTHYLVVGGVREDNILKMLIGVGDINQNGILLWSKVLNISNWVDSRLVILGNGFLLSTISKSIYNYDMPVIMRFTSTGDTLWTRTIPGTVLNNNTYLKDIAPAADGGYIFSGFNYSTQSSWVVKTDSLGYTCSYLGCDSIATISSVPPQTPPLFEGGQGGENSVRIYPNPAQDEVYVWIETPTTMQLATRLNVYDYTGRLLLTQPLPAQNTYQPILLNTQTLPNGLYFCELLTKDGSIVTGKLIISR